MNKNPDYILIGIVSILIIWGILVLASVSASFSWEKVQNPFYFLKHQLLFGFLPALILGFLVFKTRLSFLKRNAPWFYLINLILLALVFVPEIGLKSGGASRWINLRIVAFQPSEPLKLTIILYFGFWLSKIKVERYSLIYFFLILLPALVLLFFQPDASTLGIVSITAALIYFLGETPLWHTFFLILVGVSGLFTLIRTAPYRMNRFLVFLNPELDPLGMGYQLKQALIGIGSGGLLGKGLGLSKQKLGFLPQSMSDSIFAVLSEEAGFIGASILILLFLFFFWRGFKIAKRAPDKFSQLVSFGITFWITIQAFINIGAITGILPLTGIPLPFISYGGSHLIAELIGVAFLINISKETRSA